MRLDVVTGEVLEETYLLWLCDHHMAVHENARNALRDA